MLAARSFAGMGGRMGWQCSNAPLVDDYARDDQGVKEAFEHWSPAGLSGILWLFRPTGIPIESYWPVFHGMRWYGVVFMFILPYWWVYFPYPHQVAGKKHHHVITMFPAIFPLYHVCEISINRTSPTYPLVSSNMSWKASNLNGDL